MGRVIPEGPKKREKTVDYHFRIPQRVYDAVLDSAWKNRRSLNAELISRLERSLGLNKKER